MKIFRTVRNVLIKEGNLKKYLLYAVGEILLVMFGILLALQVSSWNSQRLKDRAATVTYTNIMRQINDDKSAILGNIDYNNRYMAEYEFAIEIIENNDRKNIDTLGYIALDLTKYSDVNRNSNIYQTLLNSGELSLLSNHEIIEELQQLEETYSYMNRMERIHLDVILTAVAQELHSVMKYSDRSVQKPEAIFGYKFQNYFVTMIGIMQEKDQVYARAVQQIDAITTLIEEEIRD
ncbi:MAG: hypothetical protein ABJG78_10115 [Cyclobacteriaceae bacterium]